MFSWISNEFTISASSVSVRILLMGLICLGCNPIMLLNGNVFDSWMFQQMVFSALALAQCEVMWYFQHVGIASSKSKAARMVPVHIVGPKFSEVSVYFCWYCGLLMQLSSCLLSFKACEEELDFDGFKLFAGSKWSNYWISTGWNGPSLLSGAQIYCRLGWVWSQPVCWNSGNMLYLAVILAHQLWNPRCLKFSTRPSTGNELLYWRAICFSSRLRREMLAISMPLFNVDLNISAFAL